MAQLTDPMEKLVERIVVHKPFTVSGPKQADTKIYQVGEKCMVPRRTAKAFSDRLISPKVAEAQEAARLAEEEEAKTPQELANEKEAQAEEADKLGGAAKTATSNA